MPLIEIKYGALFAAVSLLWITIEYLLGLHSTYIEMHPYVSFLFVFVAIAVIYQGVKARRAQQDGKITFGHAFVSGFYISIIAVLLSPLVNYIFHNFINPDFFASMIEVSVEQMKLTEDMAREQFNLRSYIQLNIVYGLISGALTSLGVAAVLRKS